MVGHIKHNLTSEQDWGDSHYRRWGEWNSAGQVRNGWCDAEEE